MQNSGAPPPLCERKQIQNHLIRLCKLHLRAWDAGMVDLYLEALADLTPREVDLGFAEAIRRIKFFPMPAEIRECMETALERVPPGREADPACTDCDGSGWKTTERDGRRWAVECPCRKRKTG